jgi:murein DD-endopeptidase MepM/ murein hydrolase activator NlpD
MEFGRGGPTAGAAALTLDQLAPAEPEHPVDFSTRLAVCRARLENRLQALNVVHDLAEEIGTRRWYRGLGAMLGLGVVALAFWPDFSALEAATMTSPADTAIRDEYRSQTIMPLATGGDSGRRMGATALVQPLASVPERPTIQLTATLGQGDSFAGMLQRAGVGAADAARAAGLVAAALPIGDIAPGTRFAVTLGQRGEAGVPRPLDKLGFRARFDLALDLHRQGGNLIASQRPIAVDTTPLRIRGAVGQGLYRSARASGAPMKAIQQYLAALDGQLSLEGDVLPSDQFDMIVAYKRSAGGESEVGQLLYAGLDRGGKPRAELLRWKDGLMAMPGLGVAQPSAVPMGMPVNGHMTSGYGLRRHPILGYTRMHAGIDFGAAWGSPIFAVSDGVVSFAGRHGGHGNYVRLEHGGGLGTGYGHMSRIAVSPGTRVRSGQVIGYVGSTGLSTGPHLHYEVYENGHTVNPLSVHFTFSKATPVDQKELAAFKAKLAEIKTVKPGAALLPFGSKQVDPN